MCLMNEGDGVVLLSTGTDRMNCNAPIRRCTIHVPRFDPRSNMAAANDDYDSLILNWKCGEPGAVLETGRRAVILRTGTDRINDNIPISPSTIREPDACTFRIM
jgi:hypothetical protein